jgi:hypothetical protein
MCKICWFERAFLIASVALYMGWLGDTARAQDVLIDQGYEYGVTPSPNNLAWELRTATDNVVRWEWNGVASVGPNGGSVARVATEDTAASLGLDWAAWSAAVLNPAFNRSLITWNGITMEKPWPAQPDRLANFHELDELRQTIGDWAWPQTQFSSKRVGIAVSALDVTVVPEPASWLLLLAGILHLRTRRILHSCTPFGCTLYSVSKPQSHQRFLASASVKNHPFDTR